MRAKIDTCVNEGWVSRLGGKVAAMKPEEFVEFRIFLKTAAGIDLSDNKQYLVTTRIRRILLDNCLQNLGELTQKIRLSSNRQLRQQVIDAMTTNETFWFRDKYPFEYLKKKIFPDLKEKSSFGASRIWCAACSSGQEPYSISMMAEEFIRSNRGVNPFSLDIQATDLSSAILEQAKTGIYDRLSISRGMSDQRLREFFVGQGANEWAVKPNIKQRVKFRPVNLQESFFTLGKFDVVFCRNVLIYFSADLKEDILRRIHATLKPGGYLFLGSSESPGGAAELYQMVHCDPGVVYVAK